MRSEARVVITNPTGLHARPAVKLAQLAAGFDANVEIRTGENGEWVRARSTARVMKLKAGARSTIHLRAEGNEADDALSALIDFVRRDFDEGPAAVAADEVIGDPGDEQSGEGLASSAVQTLPERATPAGTGTAGEQTTTGPAPREAPESSAVAPQAPGVQANAGEGASKGERAIPPVGVSKGERRAIPAVVASPGLAIGILHMPASFGRTASAPAASHPTTRQPTAGQPTTRQPTTRQPTTRQPTTRQPTTRQPAASHPTTRQSGEAGIERAAFDAAVTRTIERLRLLADASGGLGRDVIGFQIGLLEDEEFLGPVWAEIDAGAAADRAWLHHLAGEIADYETAPTSYLRDRAADLRDLRERVAMAFADDGHPDPDPDLDPGSGSAPDPDPLPEQCVVIADELTPSRFLELDRSRVVAVATHSGSIASHAAMLARAYGVPMLVQLACDSRALAPGTEAIVDADEGRLLLAPPLAARKRYALRIEERRAREREAMQQASRPARTRAGVRVQVLLNVDDPAALADIDPSHCDGIGLTRTEFLFHGATALPGEETQLDCYRRLVAWANGRPVTVRTLDAGGDKPIPGLTIEGESNPFLGLRGVRLSLARPEVFATQLRALARAAAGGALKVMLPMVTKPEELEETRRLLEGEVRALRSAGVEAAMPKLGMMVEVPAAALAIETFDTDFYSIGTNDLTQYVLAAARDSTAVADLLDPLHPAVLELIARVAGAGARTGCEVSVCGEMAARPECLRALLDAGIRAVSVPPAALASTRAAIAAL